MMAKRKSKKKMNINVGELGITLFKANLIGYALTSIFIIMAALVITYTNLGPNFEKWLIIIGCITSAGLVGYDTAKSQGKQGYKWGTVGGLSYLILFVIMGIVTEGAKNLDMTYMLLLSIFVLMSSGAAGVFCMATQK